MEVPKDKAGFLASLLIYGFKMRNKVIILQVTHTKKRDTCRDSFEMKQAILLKFNENGDNFRDSHN